MTVQYLSTESRPAATSRRNRVKAHDASAGLRRKDGLESSDIHHFSLCIPCPYEKEKEKKKERKASLPPRVAPRCPEQAAAALHNRRGALSCGGLDWLRGCHWSFSEKSPSLFFSFLFFNPLKIPAAPDEVPDIFRKHPAAARQKESEKQT